MTSFHERVGEAIGFGERYCLELEERDGDLVAQHPNEAIGIEVVVTAGLDRLPDRPPTDPVLVEIQHEFDGDRAVGRVVRPSCPGSADGVEQDG